MTTGRGRRRRVVRGGEKKRQAEQFPASGIESEESDQREKNKKDKQTKNVVHEEEPQGPQDHRHAVGSSPEKTKSGS